MKYLNYRGSGPQLAELGLYYISTIYSLKLYNLSFSLLSLALNILIHMLSRVMPLEIVLRQNQNFFIADETLNSTKISQLSTCLDTAVQVSFS